ncbi:hypothetical protein GCM10009813_35070 [Brevibacterium marinum]
MDAPMTPAPMTTTSALPGTVPVGDVLSNFHLFRRLPQWPSLATAAAGTPTSTSADCGSQPIVVPVTFKDKSEFVKTIFRKREKS